MKVTPVSKTLADVLRGNFIRIPRFQRPYDWDRDNLTEFWNDLKDRSDPDYFMGSLVVFTDTKEKNLISLVDGQQRITTITIMLALLRDRLIVLGEQDSSEGIHKLLETRDLDNKSRYVLEHDPADKFMQYAIQAKNPDLKMKVEGPQQTNLQSAYKYLSNSLNSQLADKSKDQSIKYIRHLRDCILQMHFVSVELDNEDDAYVIFETLNTRGKDLRVSDLLKNHFMRLIPPAIKGADKAKNQWNNIMERLNQATVSIDPDSFLLHYWLSRESYVSKANLFLKFKEKIKKTSAKFYLDDVENASSTYLTCMAPMEVKFTKEARAIQDSLNAIRIFGVAQAAPLMLAIMTQYERKVISLKTTKQAFELIEKFTFQFNALAQSRGGGGVSNMYAKLAQSTMGCSSAQEFVAVLQELRIKFGERIPDEIEFSIRFARMTYRSSYTRERPLVRYALTKLAQYHGMPSEVDVNMMTIEHILPQSVGEETADEFDVGAIGNLLLINENLNGKLGNKNFKEKKKILNNFNSVYCDEYLRKSISWDDESIGIRGVQLAKAGYNDIWSI